ncbi:MAG: hypothetical protein HWE10_05415 [Gammaproteobacteria bacterium]|nr:hypothetical protein [Gammaproteobacteria bacterium]
MVFSKVKLTSIPWLVSTLVYFSAPFAIASDTNDERKTERVPTEELVEGIKSADGRWFEVEMIFFERKGGQDTRELFDNDVKSMLHNNQWDLIRKALQPDISLMLNKLSECHLDKNPLIVNEKDSTEQQLTSEDFYQQVQDFQQLINQRWQFTNDLCLLPNESLSGYWHLVNDLPPLDKQQLTHVPIDKIPTVVTGGDHDDFHDVYLIADQNLQLKEQYYTLKKHPKLNPILHLGWRQPGLSKRNAKPLYIVAGDNLSDRFRYDGSAIVKPKPAPLVISDYLSDDLLIQQDNSESENALNQLADKLAPEFQQSPEQILANQQQNNLEQFMQQLQTGAVVDFKNSKLIYPNHNKMPAQTYKFDGYVTVHLNHYLFVDAEFNYRELHSEQVNINQLLPNEQQEEGNSVELQALQPDNEAQANQQQVNTTPELVTVEYLKNYSFKQNRRFYSGDLHYLDHPKFGILIQIRKYRH